MTEKELAEFVENLPEHLRFFFEKIPPGLDHEEFLAYGEKRLAKVRKHRDELKAHGVNADHFLAEFGKAHGEFAESVAKVEEMETHLLTLRADKADAEFNLFKKMKLLLKQMEEEAPFHPLTEKLREDLAEMAEHFPKEE
jgi:hypothetical protein